MLQLSPQEYGKPWGLHMIGMELLRAVAPRGMLAIIMSMEFAQQVPY